MPFYIYPLGPGSAEEAKHSAQPTTTFASKSDTTLVTFRVILSLSLLSTLALPLTSAGS